MTTTPEPAPLPSVTAPEALAEVAAGAHLLDVREVNEWRVGRAPEAVLLPLSEIAGRLEELPTSGRVIVVCRSGQRSRAVTDLLLSRGVDAANLDGGMMAWAQAGGGLVGDGAVPAIG